MRQGEKEAGCFIGCDMKQDGGSPKGRKQQEDAEMSSDVKSTGQKKAQKCVSHKFT